MLSGGRSAGDWSVAEKGSRAPLAMSRAEFSAAFKGSPMKRAKRRGLARNAAVALGNVGTAADVRALEAALEHDEPLVRGHAAWALGQISTPEAVEALLAREGVEPDPAARAEPRAALGPARR